MHICFVVAAYCTRRLLSAPGPLAHPFGPQGRGSEAVIVTAMQQQTQQQRKVVVAYHDEYGVWNDFRPQMTGCLPLHDVSWSVVVGGQALYQCAVCVIGEDCSAHIQCWSLCGHACSLWQHGVWMDGWMAWCECVCVCVCVSVSSYRNSRSGAANHTIDTLDVGFLPSSHHIVKNSVLAVHLHAAPYGYVYLLQAEKMDHYKSKARASLKSWVATANERQWKWCVVYLPRGSRSKYAPVNPKVYNRIFTKIKSDCGVSKKDTTIKCTRVDLFPTKPSSDTVVQWRDFGKVSKGGREGARQPVCRASCRWTVVCGSRPRCWWCWLCWSSGAEGCGCFLPHGSSSSL